MISEAFQYEFGELFNNYNENDLNSHSIGIQAQLTEWWVKFSQTKRSLVTTFEKNNLI